MFADMLQLFFGPLAGVKNNHGSAYLLNGYVWPRCAGLGAACLTNIKKARKGEPIRFNKCLKFYK